MPAFKYIAYLPDGEKVSSSLTATSKQQAAKELKEAGYLVEKLTANYFNGFNLSRGRSSKEFYEINSQLISLIKSGIPLSESLSILVENSEPSETMQYFNSVHQQIQKGASISEACLLYPEMFDEVYISLLKISEKSGDLVGSLQNYQKYLSMRIGFTSSIKQALAYPVFLIITIAMVIGILLIYVVPKFTDLFASFDAELPYPTQIIITASNVMPYLLLTAMPVVVTLSILFKAWNIPTNIKVKLDKTLKKLPFIGALRSENQVSQAMRMLSSLLNSGSPLLSSLIAVKDVNINNSLGSEFGGIVKMLESGSSLSEAIESVNFLSKNAKSMLATGEKSSSLAAMMIEICEYNENKFESKLKNATSLIEPALMLAMGLIVGFVIIAMYLPIFYLADVVQ